MYQRVRTITEFIILLNLQSTSLQLVARAISLQLVSVTLDEESVHLLKVALSS